MPPNGVQKAKAKGRTGTSSSVSAHSGQSRSSAVGMERLDALAAVAQEALEKEKQREKEREQGQAESTASQQGSEPPQASHRAEEGDVPVKIEPPDSPPAQAAAYDAPDAPLPQAAPRAPVANMARNSPVLDLPQPAQEPEPRPEVAEPLPDAQRVQVPEVWPPHLGQGWLHILQRLDEVIDAQHHQGPRPQVPPRLGTLAQFRWEGYQYDHAAEETQRRVAQLPRLLFLDRSCMGLTTPDRGLLTAVPMYPLVLGPRRSCFWPWQMPAEFLPIMREFRFAWLACPGSTQILQGVARLINQRSPGYLIKLDGHSDRWYLQTASGDWMLMTRLTEALMNRSDAAPDVIRAFARLECVNFCMRYLEDIPLWGSWNLGPNSRVWTDEEFMVVQEGLRRGVTESAIIDELISIWGPRSRYRIEVVRFLRTMMRNGLRII